MEHASGSILAIQTIGGDHNQRSRLSECDAGWITRHPEVYYLLETYRLWSTSLGWVDLHVLTAAAVAGWHPMATDGAMQSAAAKIGIPRA